MPKGCIHDQTIMEDECDCPELFPDLFRSDILSTMATRETILQTVIDTNRALARMIVLAEKVGRGANLTPNYLDDEINAARYAYFRAKEIALENGKFEGGFIPS